MTRETILRRVRLATLALFLLWIPIVFPILVLGMMLTGSTLPGLVVGALWMLAFAACGVALALTRCPQCGRRFVKYNWIYPRHCARCGYRC
jgi:hypothetical protein